MIEARPYEDRAAFSVFSMLDPDDHREAELSRGAPATHLALWAEWRSFESLRFLSLVLATGHGVPFAVLGLGHTGQSGVAQAAFLSRNHVRFRIPLGRAALLIRHRLPAFCAEADIHRIEARSWAEHPTAGRFLRACGFTLDCAMPGFGPDGRAEFHQYAWTPCRTET